MTSEAGETTELESAPSLMRLYAQAVAAPLLPGGDPEIPDRRLVLRGAAVEPDRVASYARVCGFGVRSSAPATYPHVLAFPLHMSLMTDRSFPFSVLGLVHIANRIETAAPIPVAESLEIAVRAEDLRPHRRGRQFDLVTDARLDGDVVWRARTTYLHRGGGGNGAGEREGERERAAEAELDVSADWRIPGDIGRRYAAVSGDRNPIHMHPLSARLFGFPTAIAHGMWTKARCLAAFEGRTGEKFAIEVEFKAPLRIPGRARFLSGRRDDGWRFRVEAPGGERTHLVGSIA
jgi:acyl dehydratase